jgi:putative tryptophan/tyrosine transport system substrate-binding protein
VGSTVTRLSLVAAVLILAAPLAIEAQPTGKVDRIGVLEMVDAASNEANLGAFRQGMGALGYVEGQTFVIEYRSADGRPERLSDLATELVRLEVDVLVTRGTPATLSAKQVTQTIPIVMASSGEPVLEGIVATLTRPGGNVTGDAGGLMSYGTDRRDLYRRCATYVHRILTGARPADLPIQAPVKFELAINLRTARTLGLTIPPALLRRADYVIQ